MLHTISHDVHKHGLCDWTIISGRSRISRRGRGPRRGHGLPRRLRFANFLCQNERIWTLGGRVGLPMIMIIF